MKENIQASAKIDFAMPIAVALLVVAFMSQWLGYSGTCTQGNTDSFFTGAIVSASLFVLHWIFVIRYARIRSISARFDQLGVIFSIINLCFGIAFIVMNWRMVWGILGTGETPCFVNYDFTSYRLPDVFSGEYRSTDILIGICYGVLPPVSIIFSVGLTLRILSARR